MGQNFVWVCQARVWVGHGLPGLIARTASADLAGNFYSLFKNDGHVKVTCSHLHCKCVSVLETVQDDVVVTRIFKYGLSNSSNSDDLE